MTDRSVAQSENVVLNKNAVFNASRAVEEFKSFVEIGKSGDFMEGVKQTVQIHLVHKVCHFFF